MPNDRKLALYYRPTCPFCIRVLDFIERNDIHVDMHNISDDSEAVATLVRVGGKRQVPCLFIDDKPLYESGDIIDWLQTNRQ